MKTLRQLILILSLVLIGVSGYSQGVTPVEVLRVANATTTFDVNIAVGKQIYDIGTDKLYVCKTASVSTLTLTTGTANFTLIGGSASDYATTALDNLASVAINESLISDTDNTDALGSTAINWSDLFLGDGGVIDWDNGNVKITHSAGLLTLSSDLTLAVNNSIRLSGAGGIEILSSIGRDADNYISWDSDDKLAIMIGSERHDFRSISDGAADKDKLVTQGYVDDAVLTTVNWTTWTPSIVWTSTGADPSSVSGVYRYSQIEKTVNFTMAITATMNSGTTQVTATLPVTPKDVNILVPVIAGSTIDVIGYVDAANNESSLRLLTLVFTIPSGTITFYVSGFYEVE